MHAPSLPATFDPAVIVALTCLLATGLVVFAMLRGWQDWLELKRRELDNGHSAMREMDEPQNVSVGAARIELADMKERIKKLEAIASGVEL
ncbi:MAG: hypothetical protein SXU28_12165 [Pseudomonadota bacterium]|nr:hypothetical protein [Pseudomonadota bacterium]